MLASGLQDPGVGRIGDDEAVVIGGLPCGRGAARLAILLQQGRHHSQAFIGGRRALERQAQQIHAEQARLQRAWDARPDRLVADGETVLVDTMLEAPHPPGP
jgi:hypothetical protein